MKPLALVMVFVILCSCCLTSAQAKEPCDVPGCPGEVVYRGTVLRKIADISSGPCTCYIPGGGSNWDNHYLEQWGQCKKYECTVCHTEYYDIISTYTRIYCTHWGAYI